MDRSDFLGSALLLRDISGLDRYSTRQFIQALPGSLPYNGPVVDWYELLLH